MKRVHGKLRIIPVVLGLGLIVSLVVLLTGCWPFNTAPVASFTVSALSGEAPLSVSFSAILSYDPDGIIVKFEWDFGDGTSGSGESASHTYTTSGSFTIVLRVTDNNGATDTASKTIAVNEAEEPGGAGAGPTASFTATPLVGPAPLTVTFNASASFYTGHAITYYSWDFGDGVTGTGMTTTHTYAPLVTTTYNVVLRIIASDNTEGTATKAITVTVIPATSPSTAPTASFTAAPNTGTAPVTVTLDPSGSTASAGQTITTYVWNFGDQSSDSSQSDAPFTHGYTTAAASQVFTVVLTVIDNLGGVDSYSRDITVKNGQPVAGFEMSASGWSIDDVQTSGLTITVQFRSTEPAWSSGSEPYNTAPDDYANHNFSYDPEGKVGTWYGLTKYVWDFDDGTSKVEATTGAVQSRSFTIPSGSKTFEVELEVTDKLGARGTWKRNVKLGQ